jgi:hypothetical protein
MVILQDALVVAGLRLCNPELYGWVTPAKVTRSATVKSPAVTEGRIGVNPPATFR